MSWRDLGRGWPTVVRVLVLLGLVLLVSGAGAAGACKFAFDCHLRGDASSGPLEPIADHTTLPAGFTQETIASGFRLPTAFDFLPDGRILVAEKDGVVLFADATPMAGEHVLDLTHQVNTQFFRGLLGLAVDPDFSHNHFVYVAYVYESGSTRPRAPKVVRVSRFTFAGSTFENEKVILGAAGTSSCFDLPKGADCLPSEVDHDGADIAFAADGTLFVSTGDGGGQERVEETAFSAQDVDRLGGKILHVTREGLGVPSNPFFDGDSTSNRSKVWALGLRNPFRLTLAPAGLPVVGDVGWNDAEEIDVVTRGANLGWPCFEGNEQTPEYLATKRCRDLYASDAALTGPVVEFRQPDAASVTGGVFATDSAYPAPIKGAYVFGDWARGWIRFLRLDASKGKALDEPHGFATGADGPVAFRIGPDGLLYYLSVNNGELRRIVYTG